MGSHTCPVEQTISMVFSESVISVFPAMRNLKNFTRSDEKASSYDMISRSSFAGGYGDGSDRDYPPEEQSHFLKLVFGS